MRMGLDDENEGRPAAEVSDQNVQHVCRVACRWDRPEPEAAEKRGAAVSQSHQWMPSSKIVKVHIEEEERS